MVVKGRQPNCQMLVIIATVFCIPLHRFCYQSPYHHTCAVAGPQRGRKGKRDKITFVKQRFMVYSVAKRNSVLKAKCVSQMYTSKSTILDFQTMHEASKDLKFVWKCYSAWHLHETCGIFQVPPGTTVDILSSCFLWYPWLPLHHVTVFSHVHVP